VGNIFNIGSQDTIDAIQIAKIVIDEMECKDVEFNLTGGKRGWKGDVTQMLLAIEKLKNLGWIPSRTFEDSVREAVHAMIHSIL